MKQRSKKKRWSSHERGFFTLLNKVTRWLNAPGMTPKRRALPLDLVQLEDRVLYNVAPVGDVPMDAAASAQLQVDQLDQLVTTLIVPDGGDDAPPVVDASDVGDLTGDGYAGASHEPVHESGLDTPSDDSSNGPDSAEHAVDPNSSVSDPLHALVPEEISDAAP